jgi:hypothetical protein
MLDRVTFSDTPQGRFLATARGRYEIPRGSADLYARAGRFMEIYGDDFLFVAGYAEPPRSEGEFSATGDVSFSLEREVAWNSRGFETEVANQQAAREVFARYASDNPDMFPDYLDIRGKKRVGLQLLSGGGFMFVSHAFSDEPEIRLALFRRSFAPKVLTDANGLVGGPATAEKEMVEEYTPVLIDPEGEITVLAIKKSAENAAMSDEALLSKKKSQEKQILENLTKNSALIELLKHQTGRLALHYKIAVLEELPIIRHAIALRDKEGPVLDHLSGYVGFERDQNTWVYRQAGLLRVPKDSQIFLVDGEFNRRGDYYGRDGFSALAASDDVLSSTKAFGRTFLDNWPRAETGAKNTINPGAHIR